MDSLRTKWHVYVKHMFSLGRLTQGRDNWWCLEDALEISASPISIIYSYMFCSAVFVLCYVCNPSTIFVCFIFLLTNLIAFNSCFLDIRLLTSEISSDKYSPHVRNSMLETIHIRNINRKHYAIFHSVETGKI